MDPEIKITPHENYLHVDVRGTGNYKNAEYLWKKIVDACEQYQCYNILGEQYLLNTVSTAEAFDHAVLFNKVGITKTHRIAWVDKNPRTRDTTSFIRDVLTNRSIGYGRLFTDAESAKRWLLQQD